MSRQKNDTDIIPNPLHDEGVKSEISEKVEILMRMKCESYLDINGEIADKIKKAAEWGLFTGFRMGWMICRNRMKKDKNL